MTVASPCIRICSFDPETGFCIGCGRSRREAAGWTRMDDEERSAVLASLGERPKGMASSAIMMDCATCGACSGRAARA